MEDAFHTQYYRQEQKVHVADLSKLIQGTSETVEEFIGRFKKEKIRCRVKLPEEEFVQMAVMGLNYRMRKKLCNQKIDDLYSLASEAARYESVLKIKDKFENPSISAYLCEPSHEVHVAEFVAKTPVVCKPLIPKKTEVPMVNPVTKSESKKTYSFDLTKIDAIFDFLVTNGSIKLKDGHKIPDKDKKGQMFCKWHGSNRHNTGDCTYFRNLVQDKIDQRALTFPDKPKDAMAVDEDPFPAIAEFNLGGMNMVSADLRFEIEKKKMVREPILREGQLKPKPAKIPSDKQVWKPVNYKSVWNRLGPKNDQQSGPLQENHPRVSVMSRLSFSTKEAGPTPKKETTSKNAPEDSGASRKKMLKPPAPKEDQWVKVVDKKKQRQASSRTEKRRRQRFQMRQQKRVSKGTSVDNLVGVKSLVVQNQDYQSVIPVELKFGTLDPVSLEIPLCMMSIQLPLEFMTKDKSRVGYESEIPVLERTKKEVKVVPGNIEGTAAQKVNISKPSKTLTGHLRPLYMKGEVGGISVNKILIDGGAALNVLPASMLKFFNKTVKDLRPTGIRMNGVSGSRLEALGCIDLEVCIGSSKIRVAFFVINSTASYNVLLGRDWIHQAYCIPSTAHQFVILWNGNKAEVVQADPKPFEDNQDAAEACYYDCDVGPVMLLGKAADGTCLGITTSKSKAHRVEILGILEDCNRPISMTEEKPLQDILESVHGLYI